MPVRRPELSTDLNLLPVMNLIAVLIPFLLMAAQFVSLSVIDTALPAIRPGVTNPDTPKLNLWITIRRDGFLLSGTDPMLHPSGAPHLALACRVPGCPTPEAYDTVGLTRALGHLKDEWPEETLVVLAPVPSIPYEVMVLAMDAARQDLMSREGGAARVLFPEVVIASDPASPAPGPLGPGAPAEGL